MSVPPVYWDVVAVSVQREALDQADIWNRVVWSVSVTGFQEAVSLPRGGTKLGWQVSLMKRKEVIGSRPTESLREALSEW